MVSPIIKFRNLFRNTMLEYLMQNLQKIGGHNRNV